MIFHHFIIIWQLALLSLLRLACNLGYVLSLLSFYNQLLIMPLYLFFYVFLFHLLLYIWSDQWSQLVWELSDSILIVLCSHKLIFISYLFLIFSYLLLCSHHCLYYYTYTICPYLILCIPFLFFISDQTLFIHYLSIIFL